MSKVTNYSEAIDKKFEARATHRMFIETNAASRGGQNNALDEGCSRLLLSAESFYWSSDITRAVHESSRSLPMSAPFSTSFIPEQGAWFWFQEPHSFAFGFGERRVHGLSLCNDDKGRVGVTVYRCLPSPCTGSRAVLQAASTAVICHAATLEQIVEGSKESDAVIRDYRSGGEKRAVAMELAKGISFIDEDLARFIVAASLWLQQTIVVARDAAIERHALRRIVKNESESVAREQTLRIVSLRRAESHSAESVSGQPREWSCQWIVRGHWREQFHPSTGERVPTWILPHVKGPDDKPLRTPAPAVFAVVR